MIIGPVGRQGLQGFPGHNIQGPKGTFIYQHNFWIFKLFK